MFCYSSRCYFRGWRVINKEIISNQNSLTYNDHTTKCNNVFLGGNSLTEF